MAAALKVKRDFVRYNQIKLLTFATNVVKKVNAAKEAYNAVATQFTALEKAVSDYEASYYEAESRSREAVALKQEDKELLLAQLEEFASSLEGTCKGSTTYILGAGMLLVDKSSGSREPIDLEPPINIEIRSNGYPGTVMINYNLANKSRVRIVALEWTTDDGDTKTWHNGTYFTASKNLVAGLPELKRISFRLRSIGAKENKSDWSEVVTVPVC